MNIESKLVSRIQGTGQQISCNKGWYKILEDLEEKLNYLDPEYRVVQIKEKFGTLRFYFEPSDPENIVLRDIMYDCVNTTQRDSSYTCEDCGSNLGKLQNYDGWATTACDECFAGKLLERAQREKELTAIIDLNNKYEVYTTDLNFLPKKDLR